MSQQYWEWMSDKVDDLKLSDKNPIPFPDHQEFTNMVAAVCAQISDTAMHEAFKRAYFPAGLKLSQLEDIGFFPEGHVDK